MAFEGVSSHCSSQSEVTAKDVLRQGTFLAGPLDYIARCSSSRVTLRMIEQLSVPATMTDRKVAAIKGVRQRIDKLK